ncbi:uridine kinase [Propionibacteriaceae bacterium ES.041]|nr:uridine kinase [Propionibacteriaceae bacterium ES.041]
MPSRPYDHRMPETPPRARVIVIAGPSGSGKSRLAERLGLPVLRLDDYYREGADPGLPRIAVGANAGLVDWDDPGSWDGAAALAGLVELCHTGELEAPAYDLSSSSRVGSHPVRLGRHRFLLAEGIFAAEIVEPCRRAGVLVEAYCLTQHPLVTFTRRLLRDLREARKPPLVLLRRGLALMREQRAIVAHAVAAGCRPASGDRAYAEIRALLTRA